MHRESDHRTSKRRAPTTDRISPATLIDDYAMERVEYHVARLGKLLCLAEDRRDDLRQDLFVALCTAARRFDPAKSAARTFVSRVVSLAAAHHARCIRNERRNGARSPIRLSELQRDGRAFAPVGPRWCEPAALDLVIDLGDALSGLTREQQQLAAALKTISPREIAEERGVHRSTVYREIAVLRASLAERGLDPAS